LPSLDAACSHAIKAVEAVANPLFLANDLEPILGKVGSHLDGGDVRGRMSAFVKTFHSDPGYRPVDLRVDYHPDAVSHLVQLERIERAHRLVTSALDQQGRYADVAVTQAAYELAPESAVTASAYLPARLRTQDPTDQELRTLVDELVRRQSGLLERLRRLESAGRLPAGTVDRLGLLAAPHREA
jgi:hypothetical protein